MKEEKKELSQETKSPFFSKIFWIEFVISFFVGLIVGTIIVLTEYYAQKGSGYHINPYAIALDAFGISGLLLLLLYLLNYFATLGAFDALTYAVLLVLNVAFRPSYKKHGFPATYYDYKLKKASKERKPIHSILLVAILFLIVAIILLILYEINK